MDKMVLNEELFDSVSISTENGDWEMYDNKTVEDFDGFLTDYTWYYSPSKDKHIFMFGDMNVYTPDEDYADWECETYKEAIEWFNNYTGFEDENDESDLSESASKSKLTKLNSKISSLKKKLSTQAPSENFGQKYVRQLKDEFDDITDYSGEMKQIRNAISMFDDWCQNYTGNSSIKEGADAQMVTVASDKDFSTILSLANEIGIYTISDLIKFINQESESGENLLDTVKRYRDELGPDFKIKNESVGSTGREENIEFIKEIAGTYGIKISDIREVGNNIIITTAGLDDAKWLAKQLRLNDFTARALPNGRLQVTVVKDIYEELSRSIRSFVTRQNIINKDVKMQERYIGEREIKDLTEASDILSGYSRYSKEKH